MEIEKKGRGEKGKLRGGKKAGLEKYSLTMLQKKILTLNTDKLY